MKAFTQLVRMEPILSHFSAVPKSLLRSVSVLFVCSLFACETSDLNKRCTLVKGDGKGGPPIPILKSDPIIKNSANKDFLSFGAAQCENYVCVRDSSFPPEIDDGGYAEGYCSRDCVVNSSIGCGSYDGSLDKGDTKLSCRALILDEATLAAVKAADPQKYQQVFGMTTSPFFCARGGQVADAGM